ncbi:TPA: type IV secretion system protein [Enterobacter hormaechei]
MKLKTTLTALTVALCLFHVPAQAGIPVFDEVANVNRIQQWTEKLQQWQQTVQHYQSQMNAYKQQLATASAVSRNAENVLLIEDAPQLAEAYQREFKRLWDEGTPMNARY